MPAPKRQPDQVLRDRAEIAELYLRGKSQHAIAELLTAAKDAAGEPLRAYTVSRNMVKGDLEAIRREWLTRCLTDFDQKKAEELARIDRLEAEAWSAWERSVGEVVIRFKEAIQLTVEKEDPVTKKTVKVPAVEPTKLKERRETRAGDPRFLERVAWCIDRRIRLFGLDAPVDVPADELERMLQEELAKLREAEALQAGAGPGDLTSGRVM